MDQLLLLLHYMFVHCRELCIPTFLGETVLSWWQRSENFEPPSNYTMVQHKGCPDRVKKSDPLPGSLATQDPKPLLHPIVPHSRSSLQCSNSTVKVQYKVQYNTGIVYQDLVYKVQYIFSKVTV